MRIHLSDPVCSFNGEMRPFCSRKKEQKQYQEEVEKYQKERKKGINMKALNSLSDMKEKAMK